MSGTHLMRMSQRLGNMAGEFKMQGNRMAAAAAMRTRDAIEDVAGSPAWERARATRRSQGEAFGRNAEGANATGAIRAATVVHALRRHNLKYGMVTMCVGTGQGAAGIFERV